MKLSYHSSKLTYKSVLGYSLVVVALLAATAPVLATTTTGGRFFDFGFHSTAGSSIQTARPLNPGLNANSLTPGEENWYIYRRENFDQPEAAWLSLAMRVEGETAIEAEQVNFQVVAGEGEGALPPAFAQEDLGAGIPSPLRPPGQNLLETFWTGQVSEHDRYYIRVYNHSDVELEYALEAQAEQPAVAGAIPASLGSTEALNTRQMAWTLTAQAVEQMDASQAATWMEQAQAVGWIVTAGTTTGDIPNPAEADRQLLWQLTAQAIEGLDAATAAQWLHQADALGWLAIPLNRLRNPADDVRPEVTGDDGDDGGGGSETPPARPIQPPEPEVYAPINIYPNEPVQFDFSQVNSGRLAPYGEHWYELVRDDLDEDLVENLALTLFFTPSQGFISNRVNFELFPAGQYHIWARGDADYMENFGAGMWVSRDKDPNTSERLWSGTLIDGDRYFVKIKNGTPEVVDYYLFPKDITNAELGNPTLHKRGQVAGQVPYAAAPATRPGPAPEPGAGPPEAIPLEIGLNKGKLEAGEEIWYRFSYSDNNDKDGPDHNFIFYLTNTPLDEIRARHADFEIYPASQLHLWTRGTIDELEPMGTSSPALYPELEDKRSLQVLWNGHFREDQVYYIKVYNHDIGPLEYDLEIQGPF